MEDQGSTHGEKGSKEDFQEDLVLKFHLRDVKCKMMLIILNRKAMYLEMEEDISLMEGKESVLKSTMGAAWFQERIRTHLQLTATNKEKK